MKDTVLALIRAQGDGFGTHAATVASFAAAYRAAGFRCEFASVSRGSNMDALSAILESGRVAFVHCEQGQALSLAGQMDGRRANLFDMIGVPAVAQIRDPVIAPWVWDRLHDGPERLVCVHTDPMNLALLDLFGIRRGHHAAGPHTTYDIHLPEVDADTRRTWANQRVFYVGSHADPDTVYREVVECFPEYRTLLDMVDQLAWPASPWTIVDGVNAAPAMQDLVRHDAPKARQVLFLVHQFMRFRIREAFFKVVSRYPIPIYWRGPVPHTSATPRAEIQGGLMLHEVLGRIANTPFTLNIHSNSSHAFGERVASALKWGSVPITNAAPGLEVYGIDRFCRTYADWDQLQATLEEVLSGREAPPVPRPTAADLAVLAPNRTVARILEDLKSYGVTAPEAPREHPPEPVGSAAPAKAPTPSSVHTQVFYWPGYVQNPYLRLVSEHMPQGWTATSGGIHSALVHALGSTGTRTVFHLHWLTPVFADAETDADGREAIAVFLDRIKAFKALGGRVMWTIHNIVSHDRRFADLEAALSGFLAEQADVIHVHSLHAPAAVAPYYTLPAEKVVVAPHPSYIGVYPDSMPRAEARKHLGIGEDRVLFAHVGRLEPYKGVDRLLAVFSHIVTLAPDAGLIIAGLPSAAVAPGTIKGWAKDVPNVQVFEGRVPDAQLQVIYNAADYAVLPFRDILTSGSALAALSFGCPVIMPNIPAVTDYVHDGEGALLYNRDNPNGLTTALLRALSETADQRRAHRQAARTAVEPFTWTRMVTTLTDALDALETPPPKPR